MVGFAPTSKSHHATRTCHPFSGYSAVVTMKILGPHLKRRGSRVARWQALRERKCQVEVVSQGYRYPRWQVRSSSPRSSASAIRANPLAASQRRHFGHLRPQLLALHRMFSGRSDCCNVMCNVQSDRRGIRRRRTRFVNF